MSMSRQRDERAETPGASLIADRLSWEVKREIILTYERRLVCSWCGEDYEGDPEFTASDCCSCDLVPASSLPAIVRDARRENEELLAEWMKEDEARV